MEFPKEHLNNAFKEDNVKRLLYIILWAVCISIAHILSYYEMFLGVTDIQLTEIFNLRLIDLQVYINIMFYNGFKLFFSNLMFVTIINCIPCHIVKFKIERAYIKIITILFILIYFLLAIYYFGLLASIGSIVFAMFLIITNRLFELDKKSNYYSKFITYSLMSVICFGVSLFILKEYYKTANEKGYKQRICKNLKYILLTDNSSKNHLGWKIREDEVNYIFKERIDDFRFETVYFNRASVRFITDLSVYGDFLTDQKEKAFNKCII